MNFPDWVDTTDSIPEEFRVRAKKMLYVIVACEKLRRLFNAGYKWVKGEFLTSEEEGLLSEAWPSQWPTVPTEAQLEERIRVWWEPRQQEAQATRGQYRLLASWDEIGFVDLEDML